MQIKAPAKINLVLDLGSKRSDGFHEFWSLMLKVDLCDVITIEESDKLEIRGMDWVAKENNLMYRAAEALRQHIGYGGSCCKINIEKNIPAGAGLGGGSSDCAAVLLALNELWGLGFPIVELEEIGLSLGSDVNFFLHPGSCIASGRGEIIQEIEGGYPEKQLLIINPGIHISTASVFNNYRPQKELTEDEELDKIIESYKSGSWNEILHNSLEDVVYEQYPDLKDLKKRLSEKGMYPLLSGSGSCMFALSDNLDNINKVSREVSEKFGYQNWIVKTL